MGSKIMTDERGFCKHVKVRKVKDDETDNDNDSAHMAYDANILKSSYLLQDLQDKILHAHEAKVASFISVTTIADTETDSLF